MINFPRRYPTVMSVTKQKNPSIPVPGPPSRRRSDSWTPHIARADDPIVPPDKNKSRVT
jgi:hypothetical protein